MSQDLIASTRLSTSLSRLSHLIRQAIRANAGEPTDDIDSDPNNADTDATSGDTSPQATEGEPSRGYTTFSSDREDWALERESEIIRLEKENEELRKLLGIDSSGAAVIGASEDEWAGIEPLNSRRISGSGNFRGGSIALGRKPSLMGPRATMGGPGGFALQRPGSLGWMDKHSQENLLTRQ